MEFTELQIPGAGNVVAPRVIADHRGYFARGWCRDEFAQQRTGGRHVPVEHRPQDPDAGRCGDCTTRSRPIWKAKFVRCTRGAMFDVVVDLRPTSPTYGQWVGTELTASNGLMIYVPEGCAHGYQTLEDDTDMYYLASTPYTAAASRGVRYDDAAFGIDWSLAVTSISDADRQWPDFRA